MTNPMELTGKKILVVGDSFGLDVAIIEKIKLLGGQVCKYNNIGADTLESDIADLVQNTGPFNGFVFGVVHSDFRPLQFITSDIMGKIMNDNFVLFIEIMRTLKKYKGMANGASVVAMSSISSIRAMKTKTIFCSAKAALDAAVRCLAVELSCKGIRINSIQKGGVDVDLEKSQIQAITEINNNATEHKQILGLTKASEVANLVAFLLSDAAPTITGTSIVIDGGYTL